MYVITILKILNIDLTRILMIGFSGGSDGKESACSEGNLGSIPGSDPWVRKIPWRRKWQRTPVLFLAWKVPWTEEPGRLQSIGSQRVGHDRATSLRRKIKLRKTLQGRYFDKGDLTTCKIYEPYLSYC